MGTGSTTNRDITDEILDGIVEYLKKHINDDGPDYYPIAPANFIRRAGYDIGEKYITIDLFSTIVYRATGEPLRFSFRTQILDGDIIHIYKLGLDGYVTAAREIPLSNPNCFKEMIRILRTELK